jgi:hypothetical protein
LPLWLPSRSALASSLGSGVGKSPRWRGCGVDALGHGKTGFLALCLSPPPSPRHNCSGAWWRCRARCLDLELEDQHPETGVTPSAATGVIVFSWADMTAPWARSLRKVRIPLKKPSIPISNLVTVPGIHYQKPRLDCAVGRRLPGADISSVSLNGECRVAGALSLSRRRFSSR